MIPEHCLGDSPESPCGRNREGPLCGVCIENYRSSITTGPCEECPEDSGSSWLFSILIMAVMSLGVIFVYYLVLKSGQGFERRMKGAEGTKKLTFRNLAVVNGELYDTEYGKVKSNPDFLYKMKIMVSFFQIGNVIAFQGELTWPSYYQSFIAVFKIFNFDFVPWQSLGCATRFDYYGRAVIVGCIPIVVMVLIVCFFFLPMYCMDRKDMSDSAKFRDARKVSRRKFWKITLFTAFLLYPHVSNMVLGVYNCIEVEKTYYLTQDLNLLCLDDRWKVYAAICSVFSLMYPVGIPLFYLNQFKKYRSRMREPGVFLQLGFLYGAYSDHAWCLT